MSFFHVSAHAASRAAICFVFILTISIIQFSSNTTNAQTAKPPIIPIEDFAALPNASNLKISPSGKWLSMIREIKGVPNIFIQELKNPKNFRLIPPNEKFNINWYEWANNDYIIIGLKWDHFSGNGTPLTRTRLISFEVETRKIKGIIRPSKLSNGGRAMNSHPIPQITDDVVDIMRNDPYHILVAIDGDHDGYDELRRVDIRTGSFKNKHSGYKGIQNWTADYKGQIRRATGFVFSVSGYTKNELKSFYFEPGTLNFTDYSKFPSSEKGMTPIGYTDDPDVVIMSQKYKDAPNRYLKYNMKTNEELGDLYNNDTYAPQRIIKEPLLGADINGRPIGVQYTKDIPEKILFDPEWAKLYKSVNNILPNSTNSIVSSTEDKTMMIIKASTDQDPGVYYMWDRPKKAFYQLILVNPKIDPAQMVPMKSINYAARDDLNIPGYLTTPIGVEAKNLPLVVMPHGGPEARDIKSYNYFTQFLANRGYAVLQPNFRGSWGFRNDFLAKGYQRWGLEMQDDITDGVNYLIDQGVVDPNKICIIGASYGGYAALMGTVKTPDLYKCAASINGVTHLTNLLAHEKKFIGGGYWSKSIGDRSEQRSQLRENSPALQAKKIKAPILLIQYEDDRVVPKSQAKSMRRALKSAKKKFTYKEFEKGGHSMESRQTRIEVLTELEKFLKKYLK